MRFAVIAFLTLSACSDFPALEGTIQPDLENAPFPALVPLGPVIAQTSSINSVAATAEADLSPRIARLRARAATLRGPVIPPAQRARMLRGVR